MSQPSTGAAVAPLNEKTDLRALPQHIEKLQGKLEAKQKRLALLKGRAESESKRLGAFPMGPGCGRASSRRSHYRAMDAGINRSLESAKLAHEVAQLQNEIRLYKAGTIDERGRYRPATSEQLRNLIALGEKVTQTGTLKGRPITDEDRVHLKETLRDYRAKLRKSERQEAQEREQAAQRIRYLERVAEDPIAIPGASAPNHGTIAEGLFNSGDGSATFRTMGREFKVTAQFGSVDAANAYMELNRAEGVIAEVAGVILLANIHDEGTRIRTA